jgi:hypothetical protein
MPANWPTFITNVTNFIVDEVASNEPTPEAGAEKFGAFVANEYFSAIGPATSIYGQSHGGSGSLGPLVDVYKAQFKRLLGEDTVDSETGKITYAQPDIPNSNQVDSSGNEIPFSGKKSDPNNPNPAEPDPEYADPDMTEVEEPVIDPEEMAIFLNEYSSTYNLYKYKYFEFTLDGSETKDEVANIVSNRILFSFLLETNGNKREDMYDWIISIKTWNTDTISTSTNNKRLAFKDLVYKSMDDNGYDAEYIIDKVRYRTLEKLRISYNLETSGEELSNAAKNGLPSNMEYNTGIKDFRLIVVQEVFDEDNDSDEYKVSPIITKEFITYFTGRSGLKDSSDWSASLVKTKYTEDEVENKWGKMETPDNAQDVVDKKNRAAPYMFTRQRTVDALAEIENGDAGEDPYELLAQATIDYWKSTEKQPLTATPPAPPCLSTSPLDGKYIQVYMGNKKKLAEGIRKALNAGKDSKNKREAGLKISKALSLAYTRHLMSLKFIYLGGIPVPLVPYIPMIGFVPNVF